MAADDPQCPDLSGTYQLTPGSQESRLFTEYSLPPHEMDMVQLSRTSDDSFLYRLKMYKARFDDQVLALKSSEPDDYAQWRELITQWQKEKLEKQNTSVMEEKILQIGPLPERGGVLTPSRCEAFWGMVRNSDASPVGLDKDQSASDIEAETRLSVNRQGALLFRYDNYRTTRFMFGSNMRTGIIKSTYAKLEPLQQALFDWEVAGELMPKPVLEEQHTDLATMLADVQQSAMGELPAGASITHFVPDELSPNKALWISMKGEANSNKEVSDLLRAMDQHENVDSVELVSVQYSEKDKVEFDIRLKLKN
jgi:hypothetical protein